MDFWVYAASCFGLGALHVLEPGHGKTVVAAYLVGSKGRMRDAVVLGLVTTFTHSFIVIILGILSVVAAAYLAPDRVEHILEIVAGALVIGVGVWMIVTRTRTAADPTPGHAHHGPHPHEHHSHAEHHSHEHDPLPGDAAEDAAADHSPAPYHHHDHTHTHALPTGPLTLVGLIALGISGGLVPCPGALAVLLAAVSLGQFARGIALVLIFSLGMASTLVALGLMIVKAVAFSQ